MGFMAHYFVWLCHPVCLVGGYRLSTTHPHFDGRGSPGFYHTTGQFLLVGDARLLPPRLAPALATPGNPAGVGWPVALHYLRQTPLLPQQDPRLKEIFETREHSAAV